MPIAHTHQASATRIIGHTIAVTDRVTLVSMVARLLLGQHLHVEMVLLGRDRPYPNPSVAMIDELRAKIQRPKSKEARWHRDGLVFQAISWVALRQSSPGSVASPPHMRVANKGFDALCLEMVAGREHLIICEDKATGTPRRLIKNEVLPSFELLERGERSTELQSELTTLLLTRLSPEECLNAIERIQWLEKKIYRITVTATIKQAARLGKLYKDYDKSVKGSTERRLGIAFPENNIRAWFDGFCADLDRELKATPTRSPDV